MRTHLKSVRLCAIAALVGLAASDVSAGPTFTLIRLDALMRTDPSGLPFGDTRRPRFNNRGDVLNIFPAGGGLFKSKFQRYDGVVWDLPGFNDSPNNSNVRQFLAQNGNAGASSPRIPIGELFDFNHARLLDPATGGLSQPLTPKGVTLIPAMSAVGTAAALSVDGIAYSSNGLIASYLSYRTELNADPGNTFDLTRPGVYNLADNSVRFLFGPGSTTQINANDSSIPAVMNDNGVIAGYSGATPSILSTDPAQGALLTLAPGTTGITTTVFDINASGSIIGTTTGAQAMRWTSTGVLSSYDVSNAQYFGINDRGEIVGSKNGSPVIFRGGLIQVVNTAVNGGGTATVNQLWDSNNNGRILATVTIPGSGTELAMLQEMGAPYQYQRADITGAGQSNFVWRHATNGQLGVWFMNNTNVSAQSWASLPPCDSNWDLVATGDFNSDTFADLVWRNKVTGSNGIWLMNGVNFIGYAALPPQADLNWKIVAAADFNGDGYVDIVWRNSATGSNGVWFMRGSVAQGWGNLPPTDTGWNIVGANDMNGDGKPDLVFRNPTTGANAVWIMNGITFSSYVALQTVVDTNWRVAGIADMNNDAKADVVWRNVADGSNGVWIMDGTNLVQWIPVSSASTDWVLKN
ncbi:MAG: VCBS repeat-containing protein [Phycisphaeraceae bacterium]|nr:VCBS repeat-containing protein [Phycisphaeraceae bacterium]